MRFRVVWLLPVACLAQSGRPFAIHVTDDATGRGVPLVELRKLNDIEYLTDSAGIGCH